LSSTIDRTAWALAAGTMVMLLVGLGAADIVGDDEAREVGLMMDVARGHVLWPRFNEQLLLDKPPLFHWIGGALIWLLGFSERVCRLPAAVCAAGLVGVTAHAGRALLGARAGLAAGLLLAATASLASHGRTARPDTLVLLLHTLAMLAAYRWWHGQSRRGAVAVLVWVGLAILAKGPVSPLLVLVALVPFLVWNADLGRLRELATPAGTAALLVLGGGWYAAALWGWGWAFVEQHLLGRYVGNLVGGLAAGEPYSADSLLYHLTFYPLHLPGVLMPWTPFAAVACWTLWRPRSTRDPRVRFLLCWALAPVLLFTPAEYKLRYYLLPALPPLALFTAPVVAQLAERMTLPLRVTRQGMLLAAVGALTLVTTAAVVLHDPTRLSNSDQMRLGALLSIVPGGSTGFIVLVGIAAGVLAGVVACRAWILLPPLVLGAGLAWNLVGLPALEQATSTIGSLRPFAVVIAQHVERAEPLASYGPTPRSLVVYLDRAIPSLRRDPAAVTPGLALLASPRAHARLSARGVVGDPIAMGSGRIENLRERRLILCRGLAPRPDAAAAPAPAESR
jgi:4-amino-4-deoxy-L-arabinose transferase-like glycosyltransferase